MRGRIIAFEGLDGSGKETQTRILEKRLNDYGIKSIRINFPNYQSRYSLFVKDYLNGKFGKNISPYISSIFFSLDRFGTYETKVKKYLSEGYVVICDRYVYSNLIYHGTKIEDLKERENFFNWILDFEYNKCNLPKEEITFFMDIPIDISLRLIKLRDKNDIHERDEEFLKRCYENCKYLAQKYKFLHIECFKFGRLLSINEINDMIYNYVLKTLNYEVK